MTSDIKKPHTALFIVQTGCRKTYLLLELIEKECSKHFDFIIIICPTLWENNKTYHAKEWIKSNDNVWLVDPKVKLYQWIKKLPELLRFLEVLFIISDIIANKDLDKRRQSLLELSISGKHEGHYLWLLTESYLGIPKKLRSSQGYFWYPKARKDLKMIHDENDVLTDELVVVRGISKNSEHACLYICNESPHGFKLLNHKWDDYFKWVKKDSVNLFLSISPFVVAISTLVHFLLTFSIFA